MLTITEVAWLAFRADCNRLSSSKTLIQTFGRTIILLNFKPLLSSLSPHLINKLQPCFMKRPHSRHKTLKILLTNLRLILHDLFPTKTCCSNNPIDNGCFKKGHS